MTPTLDPQQLADPIAQVDGGRGAVKDRVPAVREDRGDAGADRVALAHGGVTHAHAFDIDRPRRAHISFAGGIHSCLGMHLARVETKAMLNSLFDRVTDLRLMADDDCAIVGMPFRSPKHLPVTFGSAS